MSSFLQAGFVARFLRVHLARSYSHVFDTQSRPDDRGSAMIEFALCVGFLSSLFFGVVSLGTSLREHHNLVEIARVSARAGANETLSGSPVQRAQTVIDAEFQSFQLDKNNYEIELGEKFVNGRDALFVRIRRPSVGLFGWVVHDISASATYLVS